MTEIRKHNRYTTEDKIVDGLIVICMGGVIYGLLWALGF